MAANAKAIDRTDYRILPVFIVCSLAAFLLLLYVTSTGSVVDSFDSTVYIETARSVLSGNGFQYDGKPMTHYPPVYPLLLALSGLMKVDPLDGARMLHAVIFALNTFIVGYTVYRLTGKHFISTVCALLLFFSAPAMLLMHILVRSESPFILFALLTVLFTGLYVEKCSPWLLAATTASLALGQMTRYVGVTLLPPVVCVLLLFERRPLRDRVRDCALLSIASILPLLAWLARNMLVSGSAANRPVVFHPAGISHVRSLMATLYDFWFSFGCQLPWKILLVFLAGLFILFLFFRSVGKNLGQPAPASALLPIQTMIVVFFFSYILFLFFTISYLDAATPLDSRILSPLFASGIILLVTLINDTGVGSRLRLRFLCLLFAAILVYSHGGRILSAAEHLHREGLGYTSLTWKTSPTVAYVRMLPEKTMVYSNGADLIRFVTGRRATPLPYRTSPYSLEANANFKKEMTGMAKDVRLGNAVIIYFDGFAWRTAMAQRKDLESTTGASPISRFADGAVYGIR